MTAVQVINRRKTKPNKKISKLAVTKNPTFDQLNKRKINKINRTDLDPNRLRTQNF